MKQALCLEYRSQNDCPANTPGDTQSTKACVARWGDENVDEKVPAFEDHSPPRETGANTGKNYQPGNRKHGMDRDLPCRGRVKVPNYTVFNVLWSRLSSPPSWQGFLKSRSSRTDLECGLKEAWEVISLVIHRKVDPKSANMGTGLTRTVGVPLQ